MERILYKGKELLSPKFDLVFKALFGKEESKDILLPFLNNVLDLQIQSEKDIILTNTEIAPEAVVDGKLSRLDVCAEVTNATNNEHIDIEIQLSENDDMMKRSVYYVSKLFSGQLKKSEFYNKLGRAIGLSILDFNIFDDDEWMHRGRLKDTKTNVEFTDCFEVNFIEMKKMPLHIDKMDKKLQWLMFLNAKTEEELTMLATENAEIAVAVERLENISSDTKLMHQAIVREKTERDYYSSLDWAEKKGRLEEQNFIIDLMKKNGIDNTLIDQIINRK